MGSLAQKLIVKEDPYPKLSIAHQLIELQEEAVLVFSDGPLKFFGCTKCCTMTLSQLLNHLMILFNEYLQLIVHIVISMFEVHSHTRENKRRQVSQKQFKFQV